MNGPGHMTKMATMSIYGKILQKSSPSELIFMEHYVLKLNKVYINDDPEVTLAYFTTMSNMAIFFLYLHQVRVYRAIGLLVKYLFPRNRFANECQISFGASMGSRNEI